MIVGILIGSGIFFKSDNILVYTNGSVIKGIILFCLAVVGIVFGSLTIATRQLNLVELLHMQMNI